MKKTLHETILNLSFQRGKRKAYALQKESGGYREISWDVYRENSLKLSAFLKKLGLTKGDRVLIYSENAPEWTMLVLATTNLGATAVPVAAIGSYLEVKNTIADANPKVSFVSNRVTASRQIQEYLLAKKQQYFAWDLQQEHPLESWIKDINPMDIQEGSETDIALLIYTSGTTGNPKAVPISHGNLLSNAEAVLKVVQVAYEERLVGVLPLSHVLEFTGGFLTPALVGATTTYVKSLKAEDLLQALRDTKATVLVGVPLLFEIIGRNLKTKLEDAPWPINSFFQMAFSLTEKNPALAKILFFPIHKALGGHLKFFMTGGSRLQPQTFEFFRSIGIPILQGYGLTETSPVITVTNLKTAGPDHVGLPLPGVSVGIFNDQGESLPMGTEGEICAKGPNVFRGYLKEEHTKGVFFGEWFRTGDLGVIDEKGYLRITGRKKDIIVTAAGKNVYPEEIESEIMATMSFLEVCVLGLQDAGGHEKIGLVLVPDRTKFPNLNFTEIQKESVKIAHQVCQSLADYKRPQKIEVLFQELPKTSTRKIKKHEVKKLILEKIDASSAKGASENYLDQNKPLEATIAECIQEITQMDPHSIRLQDSLTKDLGLDSLTFVELIGSVEKKFQVKIDGVDFSTIQTIRDLITALEFAAKPAKAKRFWNKVYFTEFSPIDNTKLSWRLARGVVNVFLRIMMRSRHKLEVVGIEQLDLNAAYVFTPNHSSHFDLLSIATSLPSSKIHSTFAVAAKDYFFNSSLKSLAARIFVNAIPFDRKGRVNESMDKCREALSLGGNLVIFPEGTRSPDGRLQEFKPGVAQLLAGQKNVFAVPVFIDGAHQIMPKGSKFPKSGTLKIRYGKPISFSDYSKDADSFRKIAEFLRDEVQRLKKM
jgi:long-chain acyl-CoA synthetase